MSLKYPYDRYNGFVQLKDGGGQPYVFDSSYPDYGSEVGNAMKFAGAFLALAKRYNVIENQTSEVNK
jgi:hypothetical protein